MRKLALCLAALMSAVSIFAQSSDEIISKIEKTAVKNTTVSSPFTEKRSSKSAPAQNLSGNLSFKAPNYLLMTYNNGDKFLIDGSSIVIKRSGKEQKVDASKNLMMKSLSNALLEAFQGQISTLAKEQGASVQATKEGTEYKVVLTATKKAAKGYSKMTVFYRVSDCAIRSMTLEEFTGVVTDYKL